MEDQVVETVAEQVEEILPEVGIFGQWRITSLIKQNL